jgi:hypothetical protein
MADVPGLANQRQQGNIHHMAKDKKLRDIASPLRDATRDLVLHITESDIKGAKRKDNSNCAAAHALCRQEHVKTARVSKTKTYVFHRDGSVSRYITPSSLYTELMIFDRGGRMESGDFILQAPKGAQKLGAHVKPRGPHRTAKPPRKMHMIEKVRDDAPKGPGLYRSLMDG